MAALLAAVITPDAKEEEYTFPKKDGSTFKVKIMSMRVPELKALCGQVGQPRSGIKTVLQERLKVYSASPDLWQLLQPGARRSHKGSQICETISSGTSNDENKPVKKKTAYAKRREALLGDLEDSGPVQRSKDMRTEQEKKEMLDWAAEMSKEFNDFQTPREVDESEPLFPTPAVREKKIEAQLNAILDIIRTGYMTEVSQLLTAPPPTPFSEAPLSQVVSSKAVLREDCRHRLIAAPLRQVDSALDSTFSLTPAPLIAAPLRQVNIDLPPSPLTSVPTAHQFPLTTGISVAQSVSPKASSSLKKLVLANGTCVCFIPSDVPDPALVSFSDNIPKLVRMWDDAVPGYRAEECLLKIKGHGIPLRLWEQAYKYGGDGRWKGTKDKWGKWKFIVEAYNRLGEDGFWAKYRDTKTNKPMTYTAIVEALRIERKVHDAIVATQLHDQFGSGFKDKFGYRGQQLVKPSAIVKRSRMFENIRN